MDQLVDILGSAVEKARDLENQRQTGGRVTVKTREIGSRPAATLPDQAPILQYVRAVDAHLGIRSHLDCSSTDANLPLSIGIPAIAIGAGGLGGGAHTSGEWFLSRRAGSRSKRILLSVLMLMRGGAGARASEPPEGGTGVAVQRRNLGHDVRPGQVRAARNLRYCFSPFAFSLATVALMVLFSALEMEPADASASPGSPASQERCWRPGP
jgi:hypothetical protein